jgi:hypothetical protein
LFAAGDFETLKMVALLIGKKDSFMNYASIGGKEQAAAGIQRQLRLAADSRPSGKNNEEEEVNTVQRNRYTSKFGKG